MSENFELFGGVPGSSVDHLLDSDERGPEVTSLETGEFDDVIADGIRVLTADDYPEGGAK
jgi:hypothetical protein